MRAPLVCIGLLACTPATLETRSSEWAARTACEDAAVLTLLNDVSTTTQTLVDAGVHSRSAGNLMTARAGVDGLLLTADDVVFSSLAQVDAVSWVGPVALEALYAAVDGSCEGEVLPCADRSLLTWLNQSSTTELQLAGLNRRAASNLIAHRDGPDGLLGTTDDDLFDSIEEVDGVSYIGPVTLDLLLQIGQEQCGQADVIFSPQPYDQSHISEAVARIDAAQHSVDIAMYSFSDAGVLAALERAMARGIAVRVVYNGAAEDRKDPAGTRSASLEDLGIEVRWVNKIMHHKFALIDGPRLDVAAASESVLLTGSANWSYSGATRYDEDTAILEGDAKLALAFQREFNLLWDNGRPVVWNESIPPVPHVEITDADLLAADGSEVWLTSANFTTYQSSRYGPTFRKIRNQAAVRDQLVSLIQGATTSIDVASGHLRTRQVRDALIAKHQEGVAVRVYLDGQEWTSTWTQDRQADEHADCVAAATDPQDLLDCDNDGYHFGIDLHDAGIDTRFKLSAYRWDYRYAEQMHHKFVIIDQTAVAAGSYNLSPNAEFDTIENLVLYTSDRYPALISQYVDRFDVLWETRRDDYAPYLLEVQTGTDDLPIVFAGMALDWSQVDHLKREIRAYCPAVNSSDYRDTPSDHRVCERP